MTEITTSIEKTVEETDLPRRLKDDVYDTIEDRDDVSGDDAAEIASAVERRYLQTRVDPLDPVGTVSAQSIGEPGTQMSIPADEEIIVRRDGETDTVEIGPFVDEILEHTETRQFDDHEVALAPDGLSVPSLSGDEQVAWNEIQELSRHETPDELLQIELESGRSIRATKAHSFVTRADNDVVPVAGAELDAGDWLPVVSELSVESGSETVDLRRWLPAEEFWHTSALTDGGVADVPGGSDQLQNKRDALDNGRIEEAAIYPEQGTVGLPERLPLDEETGFFFGAWLAEGSLHEHYVSVSNVDSAFQERIRSFAGRFDLSVNEYENDSGFAAGTDIRLNGTILDDLLRGTCTDDGEKTVPGFAFGATREFVAGLLSGYFSGDGNVTENSVRASSVSESLRTDIGLLLARIGVYATFGSQDDSHTLRIPAKHVGRFADRAGMVGERGSELEAAAETVDSDGPDATDQIPNFGDALEAAASAAGIPNRQVNSASSRQRIGRNRLERLVETIDAETEERPPELDTLEQAVAGDVVWDRIESIETTQSDADSVYDLSVAGLETFTTGQGVLTHNTMNTFHYAGVAEIDVTQGLPRLIEIVDARKTPDTPMMTVYLEEDYADDRERAHEVVWGIESSKILSLGDVSTLVGDMVVEIDLNEETLRERWPTVDSLEVIASEIAETIQDNLGVEVSRHETTLTFGPSEPSYRELLQLVEELREIVFKGIEEVSRVVVRKEQLDDGEEFVLYTEGSDLGTVLDVDGVDATRTTCNNIHEIHDTLGIEAAREAIIDETMETLEEQGLGEVNIRHLMLVADIMTNTGDIQSIGRHGISGAKDSVLARAAFEVTVNHLLDAATYGQVDDLDGVTENVIVGKPIRLGTGDVNLRMGSKPDSTAD